MTRDAAGEQRGTGAAAEPSPLGAAERVIDTAQRLVVERMELLRVETEARFLRGLRAAIVAAVGYSLLVVGWVALLGALLLAVPPAVRVALAAGLGVGHVLLGAGIAVGVARAASAAD